MTQAVQTQKPTKDQAADKEGKKALPIAKMNLSQVDAGLAECDQVIKDRSETVRSKLAASVALPPAILRELSRANATRGKLMMRKLALLLDSGDQGAIELVDKLVKLKVAKAA